MAFGVPIENVFSPQRLSVDTLKPGLDTRLQMDVYTGRGVNYGPFGSMHRDEWVSFIPSHPMGVLAYQEGSLRDFSVTAAPSSVADVEDEAAVAAVDSASVALEPQQFVEVGGTQWCLIPRANLASLNAVLHAFTYQITVLFDAEVQIGLIEPPQGTIPA